MNMKKYPFCRAVHYFLDLDSFPRVPGHISYALDQNNQLKNTFSNDGKELNSITYGDVLNRRIFGLPVNSQKEVNIMKESRYKNVCFGYLNGI